MEGGGGAGLQIIHGPVHPGYGGSEAALQEGPGDCLYWDQGESDRKQATQYEDNLRALFIALRRDTGIADLQIFVREQGIFQHATPDFRPIVDAQIQLCKEDANAHLLKLDLGSNEKNFKAWAWTDKNGHLSSKAFLELSRMIMKLDR